MSNYEKRLYDVPVSNCPYCGCKRVVIHEYNDIYERPDSYRVEHMDEKEAVEAGCFESYFSFDSAEKAVEHANMRGLFTDDETNGTTLDDLHSKKIVYDVGQIRLPDGDVKAVLEEVETQDEQDTREKLEAEVNEWMKYWDSQTYGGDGGTSLVHTKVSQWLDRQDAITTQECTDVYESGCEACRRAQKRNIAELQERMDELNATLGSKREKALEKLVRDVWAAYSAKAESSFHPAWEVDSELARRMAAFGFKEVD